MNLLEAERLVRAIAEVLQHPGPAARARQLAQEYADLCRAAAHRLEQCAAMLGEGDDQQALQLADAPPILLDLITRLAFRQSQEWRAFCQTHDYPVAEAFEGKFIRQLSDAYGKGFTPNDRLYAQFREAVLRRQDDQAVAVARAIARRNPQDANAVHELARLERKVVGAKLDELAGALAGPDEARAVALVEQIEALDFQAQPAGEVWQQGQIARCRALLRQAGELRVRNRWEGAARRLTLVATLAREHGLELTPEQAQAREELEAWVTQAHQAQQEETRFQRTLVDLRQILNSWEQKQTAAQPLTRAELRLQLEALSRKWREIEKFQRPVPDELTAGAAKASALLGAELNRRNRRVRKLAAIAVALFAIAAVLASLKLFSMRAAHDLAGQFRAARQNRQVAAAEKLAGQVRAQPRVPQTGPLALELTRTDEFLAHEYTLKRQCETNLAWLQDLAGRGFAGLAPEQVQARFEALGKEAATVAADLQPPVREAMAGFERRWEEWLGQARERSAQEARQSLPALEQRVAAQLKYDLGPEAIQTNLASVAQEFAQLLAMAAPALPQLRLPAELGARLAQAQKRITDARAEAARWSQITETWRRLPSVEAYLDSLKAFQKSEFAPPAELGLANDVLGLNLSVTNLLAALLLPNQPEAWELFLQQRSGQFMPAEVLPAERGKLRILLDDPNIHNLKQYKLTEWARTDALRTRIIFVRGEITRPNPRAPARSDLAYDPARSPGAVLFTPGEYSSVRYGYEFFGPPREQKTFQDAGLKQLMDQDNTKFLQPALGVLDAVNRDLDASPLFRAFLALRLQELVGLRPAEWGAPWAPALAADRQRLLELHADTIESGDWMCPERAREREKGLEEHFRKARMVSYLQQARLRHELARRVVAANVTLAGRADAAGRPVLNTAPAEPVELWGWARDQRKPALLFRSRPGGPALAQVNAPLPFTPLFRLGVNRRAVLNEVIQAGPARPAELGDALPPLFAAPYE